MFRSLAAALLVALLAAPASADPTMLETARAVQEEARRIVQATTETSPEPTWGQKTAMEDLLRLAGAAGDLAASLSTDDPEVTPRSLEAATQDLDVARHRVKASLPLLGVEDTALLEQAASLSAALRTLDNRFWGLSQVRGGNLAGLPLDAAGMPLVYSGPEDLVREARGVRWSAEQMLAEIGNRYYPGACRPGFGVSPFLLTDLRELVGRAIDFESAVSSRYTDVDQTRREYLSLRRAWRRVGPTWGGFASWDLDRAMRRLDVFYAEVER